MSFRKYTQQIQLKMIAFTKDAETSQEHFIYLIAFCSSIIIFER